MGPVALTISRCSSSARRTISGAGTSSSQASISPRPRTESDVRQALQAGVQPMAELAHAPEQCGIVGHLERGERGRGDDGAAGERGAVVAGLEHVAEAWRP